MRAVCVCLAMVLGASPGLLQADEIPEGFTQIFNGANLAGWHISMTNHHGNTSNSKDMYVGRTMVVAGNLL